MLNFQHILKDIKELKIQGAVSVAKASAKAISLVLEENKNKSKAALVHSLRQAKTELLDSRPTEPCMANVLNFLISGIEFEEDVSRAVHRHIDFIAEHFSKVEEEIAKIGSRKITNKSLIFTHCHSSTVVSILLRAKQEGKSFEVHNTETRPMLQGRITATELARVHIPVVHYVDSAARLALKKADIMLIGADAITSEGKVINKIGSELFAEVAHKRDVPVYVCTDSWKFDPSSIFGFEKTIESRPSKEVWPAAPPNITIDNHAFESIDPELVTGIISEIGIFKPEVFVEEVKRAYPKMFLVKP